MITLIIAGGILATLIGAYSGVTLPRVRLPRLPRVRLPRVRVPSLAKLNQILVTVALLCFIALSSIAIYKMLKPRRHVPKYEPIRVY
jgi:hypothetical protein